MTKTNSSIKDLKGKKFNLLKVIDIDNTKTGKKTYWHCICDCGNVKSVRSDSLQDGSVKSCGCLKKQQDKINLTQNHSHMQTGTRLYDIWSNLKSRCYNPSDSRYENYGGRGIEVCQEWKSDFQSFYNWAILNGYDEALTIDRINNDGNYEPNNCRFTTAKEQANNRTSNIIFILDDKKYTMQEVCEILKLPYQSINARYHRGKRGFELFKPLR